MPGIDIDAGARSARRPSTSRHSLAEAFRCSRLLPAGATTYTVITSWAPPWGQTGSGRIKAAVEAAQRLQPADCDRLGGQGEKKVRSGRSRLHPCAHGADGAKARSPKRSDGSLCGPTGKGTGLAAQHEAGATWPLGRVDRSADCCADSVPYAVPPLGR